MRAIWLVPLLAVTLSTGACMCIGSHCHIVKMTPEELTTISTEDLLNAFVRTRDRPYTQQAKIRNEVERRRIFTADEWELILERQIRIGMTEQALVASLGYPTRVNRSVGRFGTHKQYVYEQYGLYVYVENYKVTSWQD